MDATKVDKTTVAQMSQAQLIVMRFKKHRLAVASLSFLAVLYTVAIFCEFFAPHDPNERNAAYAYCPPQVPRFGLTHGLYVYDVETTRDPITLKLEHRLRTDRPVPLSLFARGSSYRLWGLIPITRHFVAPEQMGARVHILGADRFGRDILSRVFYGLRISLSIGLVAMAISFVLGVVLGGASGYFGGTTDLVIQRVVELLNAIPKLPLWMAMAAIVPADWSPLATYFGMTVLLSLVGWTGMCRVVRGKILSLREEDYAVAARLLGASHARVMFRHLVPGFTSHIIVSLTMSVPGMVLGETSLSFLGLGLRPPVVSLGVMLKDCISMDVVVNYPWLLFPMVFLIGLVLCFNFAGDGMRDAADPYGS